MLQVSISGDQHFELGFFCGVQQFAVGQFRPAAFVSSDNFMLRQRTTQRFGRALIKEYAHLGRGQRAACGMVQHRANLFEGDTREPLDEL